METAELRAEIDRLRALLGGALPPPAAVPSLREAGVRTPAAEPPKVAWPGRGHRGGPRNGKSPPGLKESNLFRT